jgi:hypothetical protein
MKKDMPVKDCSNMTHMYGKKPVFEMQISRPAAGMKKDSVRKIRKGTHRSA